MKCRTFQSIIYPADKNNFTGISSILAWGKSRVGLPPPFIAKLMSLIISSINWNYKPYDLSALFGQYGPQLRNYRKTRGSRRLARETFGILLTWKRSRSPRHNDFFTDYRDIKFKLTAHRLDSENRNTVLWNKNYRNTAPKITQYRNTANPYAPFTQGSHG